jgi:hypothetical protein
MQGETQGQKRLKKLAPKLHNEGAPKTKQRMYSRMKSMKGEGITNLVGNPQKVTEGIQLRGNQHGPVVVGPAVHNLVCRA